MESASKRIRLLGVEVDLLTMHDLHHTIHEAIARRERWVIPNHNLHSIYVYHHDPRMAELYARARYIHIDGMSVVFAARLLGYDVSGRHRVTYVDWIRPLAREAAAHGWRIFYLGSKPGVAARASVLLRREEPALQIRTRHGYFDSRPGSAESAAVLREIAAFRPHILMVGMGMPRQEIWVLEHLAQLEANVILTAGACMDYVAGVVPTPPRWMGRLGLEWLYRLKSEPRRLWRRYLVEPWFILRLIARERRRGSDLLE